MRNKRGITLIALIITIIILLIISGVTINYTIKNDGIFVGMQTSKYMNRVQALDDTIKSYTVKSNNAYSSAKKTVTDLVNEGILAKITLEDDKTIYYVPDVGLEKLGLSVDLKNKTKLEEKFKNEPNWEENKFKKIEELQQYGIYVVDNDLNAAYLYNNRTYGKLYNFGDIYDIANNGKYKGKLINIYPKQIQDTDQEVVILVDRTISMALDIEVSDSNEMPYVLNQDGSFNYEAGYSKTRWSAIVNTLDTFIDDFLKDNTSQKKKITIVTYYGYEDANCGLNLGVLGTFSEPNEAKKSYSDIFSLEQYKTILSELKSKGSRTCGVNQSYYYYNNRNHTYTFSLSLTDCKERNSITDWRANQTIYKNGRPSLGPGTCTANALRYAYEYISPESHAIATDVVIITDGDANRYLDTSTNRWYSSDDRWYGNIVKNKIGEYANNIINLNKKHKPQLYGVALSKDATGTSFKQDFGGALTDANYFSVENSENLKQSFKKILEDVDKGKTSIITEGKIGEDYKNVTEVKIEVYDGENKDSTLITYDYIENGNYNLSDIYDGTEIDLKTAFEILDKNTSITADYDKIDVTIYYMGENA